MQTKRGLLAGLGAIMLVGGAAIGITGTASAAEHHIKTNGAMSQRIAEGPKHAGDIVTTSERAGGGVVIWFTWNPHPSFPVLFKMCSRGCGSYHSVIEGSLKVNRGCTGLGIVRVCKSR